MKHLRSTVMLIALSVCLTSPSVYADESEILRRLDLIEQRLNKLEGSSDAKKIIGEALQKALTGNETIDSANSQSTAKSDLINAPPQFNAKLISIKKTGRKSSLDMPLYEIVVDVSNDGTEDTSIINAYVDIKDKADNLIARIKWDGNKGIDAGKTAKMKGQYSDNPFEESRLARLFEIDSKLIVTQFNVYKVVFADGNVVEYKKCIMCDF